MVAGAPLRAGGPAKRVGCDSGTIRSNLRLSSRFLCIASMHRGDGPYVIPFYQVEGIQNRADPMRSTFYIFLFLYSNALISDAFSKFNESFLAVATAFRLGWHVICLDF
jgi:hypothetical protein